MKMHHASPLPLREQKGVFFITASGLITSYNKACEKHLNIPATDVLNRSYWDVFSDTFFGFSVRSYLNRDDFLSIENFTPPLLPHIAIEVIPIQSETTHGIALVINNLSDDRRYRGLTLRNEHIQELDKMAALVAHEIRNPLGGIKGFATLLKRDLAVDSDQHKLASFILDGTDSLCRLVNRILGYAKPLQLNISQHNLVTLMEELLLHLNADDSVDPRIELHLVKSEENIPIDVDGESLKAAMLNLCSNAIHAMPDGGELAISIHDDDDHVYISLSDTGIGISSENKGKIFSPFFTTKAEGHGFGLTEVHKIIHAHHGEVEFTSQEGKGTTFLITLPKVKSFTVTTTR